MKQLMRNLKLLLLLFFLLGGGLLAGLVWQVQRSQESVLMRGNESKGGLAVLYANAGAIMASDGVRLAYSEEGRRHYAKDPVLAKGLMHLVGDYTAHVQNSLETRYRPYLCGENRALRHQFVLDLKGLGHQGDDLLLSLDSRLSRKAAEILEGKRGALVLLDAKTGAIKALANAPSASPEDVIAWREIPETGLFHRAFQGQYAPGSTFKLVTDAAWLASPLYQPRHLVHCQGETPLLGPGSVFEKRQDQGHGPIEREAAFAYSCNHFFGEVGVRIGADALESKAKAFGFGERLHIDRLTAATSRYEDVQREPFVLSWMAIGQPLEGNVLSVTPLQLALMAGAVAHEGAIMEPSVIAALRSPEGQRYHEHRAKPWKTAGSPEEMAILAKDMEASVRYGMAQSAALQGWQVGAKTGTAQYQAPDGSPGVSSLLTAYMKGKGQAYALGLVIEEEQLDISAMAREIFELVGALAP